MLWLGLVSASSLWNQAFEAQPNPGSRDLQKRDYFVIETEEPDLLTQAHNWSIEEPFPIANHWLFSAPKEPHGIHKRSSEAYTHGVNNFYASEASKLRRRNPIPDLSGVESIFEEMGIHDPLFPNQWHIHNSQEPGHDMNVAPVWKRNITGKGVTVAIVDDGLDYDHPDFEESFSAEGSWDYNLHQQLPKPLLDIDTHGTRCAGEVAAGINKACGVGIAPGAKVAGIRILSGDLTSSDEARALIHRYNVNDIYSCSWGPTDDGLTIDGPPALVRRAELDGIENGRDGKGSIYVVASGNGDLSGDNCNYDGYTNSIYSITVGAIDRQNRHPFYAESCSANMVVTYSSNYFDKITTSDRLDPEAPDVAKCTNKHSGTSAAAPIAAGIFALVLEQRPDLTWRDLQYLVRDTAKYFDIVPNVSPTPDNRAKGDWITTADGHRYHNSYGYGLLDADAIVARAETWELVKPQTWYFLPMITTRHPITPTTTLSLELTEHQWIEANMDHIEHVRVRLSWEHEVRGALTFQLESPAGVVSELAAPRMNDLSSAPVIDWEFLSVVHWNETGPGVWKLKVQGPDELHGVVFNWQLKLFGQAKDPSKVKRFSEVWNEYEKPVNVVKDPLDSSGTHSGEASGQPTSSESAAATATTGSNTHSTTSTPASATASSEPSTTDTAPPSKPGEKTSKFSVMYYIAITAIGIAVLALLLIPAIYFGFWRRKSNAPYVQLDEEEFELDDASDNFEIDENDLNDEAFAGSIEDPPAHN